MSSGQIEPIPEGFLAKLLQAFGIQWTHLVILSGVIFSSFSLQRYLNPGVWMLGTVAAFSLVYLFRHHVSGNFLKVAAWASVTILVCLLAPLIILIVFQQDILKFITNWTESVTLYLSIAIGIPIGIAILSYRSQDEFLRTPLPPALAKAVRELASQNDFVYESVCYEIELCATRAGEVIMRFVANMDLLNRSKRNAGYRGVFDPAGRNKKINYVIINGSPIDKEDPDRIFQRGLLINYEAKPNERFKVVVCGESTFYGRDSELVGTYLPCNYLLICIKKPPKNLSVNVQCLLPKKVNTKPLPTGDLLFEYFDGVLPFQGTRLFWELHDLAGKRR